MDIYREPNEGIKEYTFSIIEIGDEFEFGDLDDLYTMKVVSFYVGAPVVKILNNQGQAICMGVVSSESLVDGETIELVSKTGMEFMGYFKLKNLDKRIKSFEVAKLESRDVFSFESDGRIYQIYVWGVVEEKACVEEKDCVEGEIVASRDVAVQVYDLASGEKVVEGFIATTKLMVNGCLWLKDLSGEDIKLDKEYRFNDLRKIEVYKDSYLSYIIAVNKFYESNFRSRKSGG